jgi:hypothetical protein
VYITYTVQYVQYHIGLRALAQLVWKNVVQASWECNDRIFGFQGDVWQGNQINLVEWPNAPFTCSGMVTVHLLDEMDDAWTNANGADAVGPYAANDPNTEQVRALLLYPIPQCYVGLCVNRTYTPQTFWTDVIGQIRQDQLTVDCNTLVNWARVASTYGPPDATGQTHLPISCRRRVARTVGRRTTCCPSLELGCGRPTGPRSYWDHVGMTVSAAERGRWKSAPTAGQERPGRARGGQGPQGIFRCLPARSCGQNPDAL